MKKKTGSFGVLLLSVNFNFNFKGDGGIAEGGGTSQEIYAKELFLKSNGKRVPKHYAGKGSDL